MSLDSHYQKLKFLKAVRELIANLYAIKDSESSSYKTKGSEFDGFVKAGMTLGIATKDEIQKIIDDEHWSIFQMTREERKAKKATDKNKKTNNEVVDWAVYDIPTIKRK
jgi:hypothetical protein